jgi:hypothetical protein
MQTVEAKTFQSSGVLAMSYIAKEIIEIVVLAGIAVSIAVAML